MVKVATARGTFSLVSWLDAKLHRTDQRAKELSATIFRAAAKSIASKVARVCVRDAVPIASLAGVAARTGRLAHHPWRLSVAINQPEAARAVGSAVGANPIAFIVPCHSRDLCRRELSLGSDPQTGHDRLGNFRALAVARGRTVPDSGQCRLTKHKIDNLDLANTMRSEMSETPHDPGSSRYEHAAHGLRRRDLDPDPIKQFANWFTAAIEAGIRDVNAMSLATAGRDARPSVRVVLLKGFDQAGFVFFTSYESEKGKQLEANPYAGLAFYWIELDRQIRISGAVEKTSREESERYFHSRPRGSQLGAWASRQSEVVDGRRVLDARMAEMTERFADQPVALPPHWGGYRVKPEIIEFWQGRPNRLHDRLRYTLQANGEWLIDRLAP